MTKNIMGNMEKHNVDIYLFTNKTEPPLSVGALSHASCLSRISPTFQSLLKRTHCPPEHVTHAALSRRGTFL